MSAALSGCDCFEPGSDTHCGDSPHLTETTSRIHCTQHTTEEDCAGSNGEYRGHYSLDPNTCKWYGTEESGDGDSYFGGGGGDGDAWLWLVLGAALAFALALGAIAFSVRRDLKAERAGTRKKGTWRAHLKLHLAALALVSLCAWLVVWLVVYDKELPEDVVGFAAVVFEVTLKSGVMALLFARYVAGAGAGAVVAPADPEGKVGAATSLRAWTHETFELDAASARARGGVDAELHVRRIRMRLACLEVWALLAVPLACVYALDPKECGWLPERKVVEEAPDCTGVNPCCEWTSGGGWYSFLEVCGEGEQYCWTGSEAHFHNPSEITYELCCDMLGIDYEPNNWGSMGTIYVSQGGGYATGLSVPACGTGCGSSSISAKCEGLISEEKQCEPVCLVKTKPAGWGRARSPGFDRISLENVMCREGNTATWQLWIAVLALYLGHWAAYRIIDAHDEEATDTIRAAAEDAPPHHYAVAMTGLRADLRAPAALEAFFEGVFAAQGSVVRVVPCRHLSEAARAVKDVEGGAAAGADAAAARVAELKAAGASTRTVAAAEARQESVKDRLADLFGGDGGARGRVQAFREALKEVERAEWRQALYERWESEEKKMEKCQRSCAKCIDGCICCCSFVEHRIQDEAASPADARRRCEEARKAVADHAAEASPNGGSAIVVFSSLEIAQAAANCPLGASDAADAAHKGPTYREEKPHRKQEKRGRLVVALETAGYYITGVQGCGWTKRKPPPMEVTPLPEPRDIDWGELETLDEEHGEKADRMNAGRLIKLGVWFGYSAIVAVFAVNWEALCEKYATDDDGEPTDNALLWDLLAGFVPAYFQDWLFDYVAVILYNTNRMFNSLWSESKLQGSVARDYSIFFWIVAFGAYLLSVTWADITNEAWVCEGACDTAEDEDTDEAYDLEGGEKFNPGIALKLMARAVPRHAWPFASIFLMQIGDMVADALRVVPYIKYKLLKRAKVASDASVEESLEPDDADLGAPAGWEAFALLVGASYAAVSPFTCAVCYLYFVAAYEAGKHALCCLESMPFDTRGSLWFDGVAQTHAALFIALVVQLGIICFNSTSKGWYPALGGIPIFLMWKRYRDIARRRYAKRNLHGLSRGRMPLQGAAAVDRGRDAETVRDALAHLADRDRFFEAPEVLPPEDHPVYRDALPGPPIDKDTDVEARLEAVNAWLERHDDAAAAFLERVKGASADATDQPSLFGGTDDVIVDSDDIACGTMGCGGL